MFRKDRKTVLFLGFFLFMILIGALINVFIRPMRFAGIFLIICGLIGLITGVRIATKPIDHFKEDERSDHIKEKAGYHTFWAILYIAAIIILLRMLKLSPSLTPSYDLSEGARHLWLIGVLVFLILRWYYNKRGEA